MKPIVIVGDANVDLVIRLPDPNSPDIADSVPQLFFGGTGANTAVALARLGIPVKFVGTVGDDGFGRRIRQDFQTEGVDTSALTVLADAFTPQVIALVKPDGERYLVIFPPVGGAQMLLERAHIPTDLIRHAAWVHTTGMCLRQSPIRETILETMALAQSMNIPTSIDLNLRIELWGYDDLMRATVENAIRHSSVVFGSADEEIIPVSGESTLEAAARKLSDNQRIIVARRGAAGAYAYLPTGEMLHAPALPATVIDTIGAGDAFNGGFLAALGERGFALDSESIDTALHTGNAVAAYKIARAGARALPTRDDALIAAALSRRHRPNNW